MDTIVTKVIKIDKDNLPKGRFWDSEGACYSYERMESLPEGYYLMARNLKALGKGYIGQPLNDCYIPPYLSEETPHD